jgi:hypothetical protein
MSRGSRLLAKVRISFTFFERTRSHPTLSPTPNLQGESHGEAGDGCEPAGAEASSRAGLDGRGGSAGRARRGDGCDRGGRVSSSYGLGGGGNPGGVGSWVGGLVGRHRRAGGQVLRVGGTWGQSDGGGVAGRRLGGWVAAGSAGRHRVGLDRVGGGGRALALDVEAEGELVLGRVLIGGEVEAVGGVLRIGHLGPGVLSVEVVHAGWRMLVSDAVARDPIHKRRGGARTGDTGAHHEVVGSSSLDQVDADGAGESIWRPDDLEWLTSSEDLALGGLGDGIEAGSLGEGGGGGGQDSDDGELHDEITRVDDLFRR